MTEFSYERKVKLRDKIQKLVKSKEELVQIKTLLKTHNPKLPMTKNKNGYFIDILDLEPITYVEITKFLDKLDKKRSELEEKSSLSDTSKNTKTDDYTFEKTDEFVDQITQKKLKYKNSENHILNRVKYEKALKAHQEEDVKEQAAPKSEIFKKREKN